MNIKFKDFLFKEISYSECLPFLKKLWPDKELITSIDNTMGMIKYHGKDITKIKPKFFGVFNSKNILIGFTSAYMSSPTELRIRGVYVEPDYRRDGIAKEIILSAIDQFPDAEICYIFPRLGNENFWLDERLGFILDTDHTWPDAGYKGIRYAYKKLR